MWNIIWCSNQWWGLKKRSAQRIFSKSCDSTHLQSHIPSANEAKIVLSPGIQAELYFKQLCIFELKSMIFLDSARGLQMQMSNRLCNDLILFKTPQQLFLGKNQQQQQQRECCVNWLSSATSPQLEQSEKISGYIEIDVRWHSLSKHLIFNTSKHTTTSVH